MNNKSPLKILIDGEPTQKDRVEDYDIAILAGGSNHFPQGVHLPLLALEKTTHNFHHAPVGKKPSERPIDVLYRSSNCTPWREKLATELRQALERENLRFVATGKCTAGGTQDTSYEKNQGWGVCSECEDAKMMISFENFSEGRHYLSEKPFLGWQHGSIPLYKGNGQSLMREVGILPESMVDAGSFADDHAFVDHVVALAKDPARLEALQRIAPLKEGQDLRSTEPLRQLASRRGITPLADDARVFIDNLNTPLWEEITRTLGATRYRQVHSEEEADLVMKTCCGWSRTV